MRGVEAGGGIQEMDPRLLCAELGKGQGHRDSHARVGLNRSIVVALRECMVLSGGEKAEVVGE